MPLVTAGNFAWKSPAIRLRSPSATALPANAGPYPWVRLPDSISRYAPELWDPVRPLYHAGDYAEAADRGRELIEARPDQAYLYYNVACCESLAGRRGDAVEHLRQAMDMWEGFRDMASGDSDFDAIRDEPVFQELIGR
jgi:tetratricopeptide (TPR) repeat protein